MHFAIDDLPHLAIGWGCQKVNDTRIRAAQPLVDSGVTFSGYLAGDPLSRRVATLNAANIEGPTHDDRLEGLAALDSDGDLIGAVSIGVEETPAGLLGFMIRYVAVDHSWRGRGVGTVLLCTMDQNIDHNGPRVFYGGCSTDLARFYKRAGFDVLQPGVSLPTHIFGAAGEIVNPNEHHPCWFVRTWSPQRLPV